MHYNGNDSFLYANGVKICQFKAKNSEMKLCPLCVGNILKDFTVDNMKKTGLYGYMYDFSVDCNTIDISDFLDIRKYLMKKHDVM